jgi:hypothetical protein
MTPMHACPHFNDCSAPLCPLDPDNEQRSWFSDEDICQRRIEGVKFVPVQRRIARAGVSTDTYFTVSMLEHKPKVSSGLRGLDPDSYKPRKELLESWFENHKGRAPLSEEKKEELREQIKMARSLRKSPYSSATA